MAAIRPLDLGGRRQTLRRSKDGVRFREHVLMEEELPSRLEDPPDLRDGFVRVQHGAQGERANCSVCHARLQGQSLGHAVRDPEAATPFRARKACLLRCRARVFLHAVVGVHTHYVHASRRTLGAKVQGVREGAHPYFHNHGAIPWQALQKTREQLPFPLRHRALVVHHSACHAPGETSVHKFVPRRVIELGLLLWGRNQRCRRFGPALKGACSANASQ
mmetsp:Transcript_62604/g.201892  ORF Transcript_62604/g.201892 Transcript_62604/m.201892 type:complete len:219 (-) Transcript_62604:123-779(-)